MVEKGVIVWWSILESAFPRGGEMWLCSCLEHETNPCLKPEEKEIIE